MQWPSKSTFKSKQPARRFPVILIMAATNQKCACWLFLTFIVISLIFYRGGRDRAAPKEKYPNSHKYRVIGLENGEKVMDKIRFQMENILKNLIFQNFEKRVNFGCVEHISRNWTQKVRGFGRWLPNDLFTVSSQAEPVLNILKFIF